MQALRCGARGGAEGLGVEAELEDVSGLRLDASQLGVDGLVGATPPPPLARIDAIDPHQEVRDPTHAVVDEGHLGDHVVPVVPRAAHPGDPVIEALTRRPARDLVDAAPLGPVVLEALGLVLGALVGEQPGEAPEVRELGLEEARIGALAQAQIVGTVEPRGDLRG